MSFGFGVGDFLAVAKLARKVRKDFVGAPAQLEGIAKEVKNLTSVLQDIEDELETNSTQTTELKDISAACEDVLKDVTKTLDKYSEVQSGQGSPSDKVKRVWKRLKLEPSDIIELRDRITSTVTLLNTFVQKLAYQATLETKRGVDCLVADKDNQERRKILDWITDMDYAPQHNDHIKERQEGTGLWLLDSNKYQTWLRGENQTLFCPGIPGAGKTVLSAVVISKLLEQYYRDPKLGVAYIYFHFRMHEKQGLDNLVSSLLKQLCELLSSVPAVVQDLYKRHTSVRTRPTVDELLDALAIVATSYTKVFIVVDALDECQENHGCRKTFIDKLLHLQGRAKVNLFATSRFIPNITERFKKEDWFEIRASTADIERYLDHRVQISTVAAVQQLRDDIKTTISQAADGMFLLARIYLDEVSRAVKPRQIHAKIRGFQKQAAGSGEKERIHVLQLAYKAAMERIEEQEYTRDVAKQALAWITCAKRPLSTTELRHALTIEEGDTELLEEDLVHIDDIVAICAGLVTIDEESDIIRLVHFTTQEYFEQNRDQWFPSVEEAISKVCITYLSFDSFETGYCRTDAQLTQRLLEYPLYDYAAKNWGHHARHAPELNPDIVITFLYHKPKADASAELLFHRTNLAGPYPDSIEQLLPLHLASYFGILEVVKILLLTHKVEPDLRDASYRTALSWAAEFGHVDTVTMLLDHGAAVNWEGTRGNILSYAIREGNERVVKLLLDRSADFRRFFQLHHACRCGSEPIVRLLLDKGVEVSTLNQHGETAFQRAIRSGSEAVVTLLIRRGVSLESRNEIDMTPLAYAAELKNETIARLLLDEGAEIEARDSFGRTPLCYASYSGSEAIVKLLLNKGADIESRTCDGQTPLAYAISGRSIAVTRLLVANGANLNTRDKYNETPLTKAVSENHSTLVKVLLDNGAYYDDFASTHVVPLIIAAENNSRDAADILLQAGADIEARGEDGQTALCKAASKGHAAMIKILLSNGANIEAVDSQHGRTPLLLATLNGYGEEASILLEGGANMDVSDNKGCTPLIYASREGCLAVVKALLSRGASIEHGDDLYGRTPLSWAAGTGDEKMVNLLLESGACLETRDKTYRTPLHWAIEENRRGKGNSGMIHLLLEKGANIEAMDQDGRTPLSRAAERGDARKVKYLVKRGARLDVKDTKEGLTALDWALRKNRKDVANVLSKASTTRSKLKAHVATPIKGEYNDAKTAAVSPKYPGAALVLAPQQPIPTT
ncbi:hypothetical protein jhhlp_001887 [Lomentospora prolificans]|uniref:Uncharacterized protein n=1 Tax=Lomentospora prolificans TaxID=41688 RepID=A0A2N3NCL1_9PEZI|nr:hypothetical protein jhhlp_001887 [Lomentospora prolificans]